MTIFKSHSTQSQTGEKVTTSNHYNLTGNFCENLTQMRIEPRTFGLPWQDHRDIRPQRWIDIEGVITSKYLEDSVFLMILP